MPMQVEVSRRRFLQGSVALSVAGATAIGTTNILANTKESEDVKLKPTKKTPTLCEMCVNKCTYRSSEKRCD